MGHTPRRTVCALVLCLLAWRTHGARASRIAFASMRDGVMDIYSLDADGGALARLTMGAKPDAAPAWSPDGRHIVFHSVRDGDVEVYAMHADGANQTRLTERPGWDADPAPSPDGRQVAFVRSLGWLDQRLYLMGADGAN